MKYSTMIELAGLTTEGRAALKEDLEAFPIPEGETPEDADLRKITIVASCGSRQGTELLAAFVEENSLSDEAAGLEDPLPRTRKFLAEMVGELTYLDHTAAEAVGVKE
jgi:hypothetical protein